MIFSHITKQLTRIANAIEETNHTLGRLAAAWDAPKSPNRTPIKGQRWTAEEITMLLKFRKEGYDYKTIAKMMGTNYKRIENKCWALDNLKRKNK